MRRFRELIRFGLCIKSSDSTVLIQNDLSVWLKFFANTKTLKDGRLSINNQTQIERSKFDFMKQPDQSAIIAQKSVEGSKTN